MNRKRRKIALALALAPGCWTLAHFASAATPRGLSARFAASSRTTEHCLPWIAAEAGIFARLGIAPSFADAESSPSDELAGLAAGKWDFAHAGIAQVAQRVLQGDDAVLVAMPWQAHRGGFVMTRPEIRNPEQLEGARVGVLSESGSSALAAHAVFERWRVSGTLVPLKTFDAIYQALAERQVDAGWLPIDLSLRGRRAYGWNAFPGVRFGIPGGIVTTRRTIASDAPLVTAVVKAIASAIHFLKSERERSVSLLQRWLRLEDRAVAEELRDFYDPILRTVPTPTAFFGMQGLRESLAGNPAAARLQPPDFMDASFVDALERSGYISQLYSSLRYQ